MAEEIAVTETTKSSINTLFAETTNMLDRISRIAERGPINLTFSVGALLILMGLLFKIDVKGARISTIGLGEFITILLIGSLLMLCSATIKFLQFYVTTVTILKEQQRLGGELMKKSLDNAADLAKTKIDPNPLP